MMRKLLTAISLLLLNAIPLMAQIRSAEDAGVLANSFWPRSKAAGSAAPQMVFTAKDSANQHPYFYVFNRGTDQGFVIISADERSKKILGYSDTGRFDVNDVPPEMQKWLRIYQGELKDLSLTPDSLMKTLRSQFVLSKARTKGAQSFAPAVKPLLRNINFSQKAPFNAYCPQVAGQPCVSGCVATGASQIMRYWQYPVEPTGRTHTYITNGQQQSVRFDTRYDWGNILPSYSSSTSSREQQMAVARLVADAGLSCNTTYSPRASGANTNEMAVALVNYFGYDRAIVPYVRNDMTEAEFVFYLKRELNAGRPVLVTGDGAGGAHCFVCDGYDENGLFHINWGWNGTSNGYFQISNLNPYTLGTGGGTGGGFSNDVKVFGGIQPAQAGSREVRFLSFAQMGENLSTSGGRGGVFQLTKLQNNSLFDFNGLVGVALYSNGQKQSILASVPVTLNSQFFTNQIDIPVELPKNLAAGRYELVIVSKDQRDDTWRACLNKFNNCVELQVSGSNYAFSYNNNTHYCDLPANGFDLNVSVGSNNSPQGGNNGNQASTTYNQGNTSNHGNTSNEGNPNYNSNHGNTVVSPTPVSGNILSVVQPMTFVSSDVTSGNQTLQVNVRPEGNYNGKVGVFLYDGIPQRCLTTLQTRSVSLNGGQPVALNFTGIINLPPGKYHAFFFYTNAEGKWTQAVGNYASVPFNVASGTSTDMADLGGHGTTGFQDPGMAFAAPASAEESSDYLIDDGFWDNAEETDSTQQESEAAFKDFADDVTAKDATQKADIVCQSLTFVGAEHRNIGGHSVYAFQTGREAKLDFVLTNQSQKEQTRIITLSIFDKDDHWVTDLAECMLSIAKGASTPGSIVVSFADVQPGAYRLRLTEAHNDTEVSQPITPPATSSVYVEVQP